MADSTAPRTDARATNGQGKLARFPQGPYRVFPVSAPGAIGGATCTCEWFCRGPQVKACSHVDAVIAFARTVQPAASAGFLTPEKAAEVQASTVHAFDRIERSQRNSPSTCAHRFIQHLLPSGRWILCSDCKAQVHGKLGVR